MNAFHVIAFSIMSVVNSIDACLVINQVFHHLFRINSDVLDNALVAFVLVEPVLVVNAVVK